MLSLATVAFAVGLALAAGAYAVAGVDALDYRTALVAAAVLLAAGGAVAQVTPAPATDETAVVAESPPTATGPADAGGARTDTTSDGGAATAGDGGGETTDDGRLNATVVDVDAADRITYRVASGARRTVRLAGVDAPGAHGADPDRFDGVVTGSRGRACLGRAGREAIRGLRARLLNETVTVRRTGSVAGVQTAVLIRDGDSVNRRLVERGDARATDDRYADAERSARSASLGVWSCATVEPDRPRREINESGLRITAVHPNPPGDDDAALEDEYLVVENVGRTTVDLSNWYLAVDGTYHFLDGPELRPGAAVVVHVGPGRDTDDHRYLGLTRPLLDNDHGTVKLVDGSSNRVIRLSY